MYIYQNLPFSLSMAESPFTPVRMETFCNSLTKIVAEHVNDWGIYRLGGALYGL